MSFNPKDHYFFKAKKDGYVARSAYKLLDIQKKHNILKNKMTVLDLGSSPGSWSQVALKLIGPEGQLVGIDLKPTEINAPNARFIIGDILTADANQLGGPFDVVMSDMAPNTTGIRIRDQAQSEELCRMVLKVAEDHLKTGGHVIMKVFEGPDVKALVDATKKMFTKVDRTKPEGVRKGSFESYIIGIKKK